MFFQPNKMFAGQIKVLGGPYVVRGSDVCLGLKSERNILYIKMDDGECRQHWNYSIDKKMDLFPFKEKQARF